MFIQQAFKPGNSFGKYLLGSLIIFAFSFIGQIPLIIAVFIKSMKTGRRIPASNEEIYSFFDANTMLFLMMLSFVVALIGIFIAVRSIHRQKIKEIVTARPKVDWKRFFFAFTVWGLFTIVTTLIGYFASPEDFVIQFEPISFLMLCAIAIPLIPIQTSVEELVFRGYLMQGFGLLAKNRWFPLVMTSVIFGSLHLANPEIDEMGYVVVVYYILTGLVLGVMTLMDEGTELSLGFHAANNLIAALLVTSDYSVLQTYAIFKDLSKPTAGFDVILPAVIIYPIILLIFARKYKWNNWKEKLIGKIMPPDPLKNPTTINPYNEQSNS